jgi:ribosomal protein S18 acetylase RimI-like enzyme
VTKASLDLRRLEIRQLTAADLDALRSFDCGDEDLNGFVRDDALRLATQRAVTTYIARYDGSVVGYVSLMVDAIVLETKERKRLAFRHDDHPVVPALKVARLGVSSTFRSAHSGLGMALMRLAATAGFQISEWAGCRLLTVDAYPQAIAFYERLGFLRNRSKEYRERTHPSMRLDLFASAMPSWLDT